jgi:hypothetical protein
VCVSLSLLFPPLSQKCWGSPLDRPPCTQQPKHESQKRSQPKEKREIKENKKKITTTSKLRLYKVYVIRIIIIICV